MSVNNGTFFNDLITNSLEAQSIKVIDSIDVPSITIGGSVFNGDVSGGVTLPYLEVNDLKKSDAAVLKDISSTATQVISTKTVNAPSVSTGNVNATNVYTNMNSISDSAAVNVAYVTNLFPKKTDVYTKAALDAITSTKLDVANFNTFQQTNAQNLASKQDLGLSYLKSQTDTLIGGKVDNSTFGTYQGQVTSQLGGKLNVGDAYTKAQVDNIASGKLPVGYAVTNDAAVASKVSQFNFDQYKSETAAALAAKGDITSVYTKSEADTLLNTKVSNDAFQTYSSANSNALNTKVSQASFDSFKTTNTSDLNSKVSNTTFGTFQMSNAALIDTKHSIADFNTFNTGLTTTLNNKVNVSNYNSFKAANDTALGLKLDTSVYNTNKQNTDTLIGTKANSADVYNKTQVDSKDAFIQNSLDTYKTSTNTTLGTKLDTSTFAAFDSQNLANINGLQSQINQRVKITDFDSFRSSNSQRIDTKQDIIPFQFNQNLTSTDSPTFAQITVADPPANATSVTNKTYVDSVGGSAVIAGTGLTKASDNTLSVNAAQSQITSIGTLSGLSVTGNSTLNGQVVIAAGDNLRFMRANGATGQMMIGGDSASNEIFNFKHVGGNGEFLFSGSATSKFTVALPASITNTTESTSPTTGALKIAGGLGVAKMLQVGGGELIINNGPSNGSRLKLNSTSNSMWIGSSAGDSAGDFHVFDNTGSSRVMGWYRSSNNFVIGYLNGSTNTTISGTADSSSATSGALQVMGGTAIGKSLYVNNNLTVIGSSTLNSVNTSSITNAGTVTSNLFYSLTGQLDMAQSGSVVSTLSASGSGNTAQMNLIVNGGSTNTSMFKFYRSGSPSTPLATISGVDGAFTAGNFATGVVNASTTQASVTMGRSADFVNWTKTGKIVQIYYQLVLISQSGNQSGPVTFQLPVAPAISATIDNHFWLYRNGSQVTNVRINLTANSTSVTLTEPNGLGGYRAFSLTATENLTLMFNYPTV